MRVSISESMVERVRAYIKNQKEHHKKISYLDECKKFLKYIGQYPIKKNKSDDDSGLKPDSNNDPTPA
jgi:hypothetical protein